MGRKRELKGEGVRELKREGEEREKEKERD